MEIKYVYRRRVKGERPPCYLIKILSFTSGFMKIPTRVSKEQRMKIGTMIQRRGLVIYVVVSDGSSIERIPNECPNRRAYLHRKCKQKRSVSSDWNDVSHNFRSLGLPRRFPRIKSALRGRLYDNVFDRYFRRIWMDTPEEKRDRCTYLNCLWFCMYNNECFRDRVLTWIKKENIFSKTYVFVPIVMWSHWYLLIMCHFGESLKSGTRTPCMLLLDSLRALDPMRLEPLIRSFVVDIFETQDRHENIS
ncbi:putative ubiquitin-like-specific protease 2A [Primulina tabacum]|uniref:putative ubiquitin-like-specific protease 2A n=1 Tax=Primulina tabacum TaxID=48773 RepID=UPI003F5A00C9